MKIIRPPASPRPDWVSQIHQIGQLNEARELFTTLSRQLEDEALMVDDMCAPITRTRRRPTTLAMKTHQPKKEYL